MSLSVYLTGAERSDEPVSQECIFIREDGQTKQITRAEWDDRFPDQEPYPATFNENNRQVYWANITGNLARMADQAGLYDVLWRPDDVGFTTASQLVATLQEGLALLESDPERFKQYNPGNGWGTYDGLVEFVRKYLAACIQHPTAEVSVSR